MFDKIKSAVSAAKATIADPEVQKAIRASALTIGKNVAIQTTAAVASHYAKGFLISAIDESRESLGTVAQTISAIEFPEEITK